MIMMAGTKVRCACVGGGEAKERPAGKRADQSHVPVIVPRWSVHHWTICFFVCRLTGDANRHGIGTVISITSQQDPDFTAPIIARLRQRDTILRQTADPSLLIQSLLDLGWFSIPPTAMDGNI